MEEQSDTESPPGGRPLREPSGAFARSPRAVHRLDPALGKLCGDDGRSGRRQVRSQTPAMTSARSQVSVTRVNVNWVAVTEY